MTKNQQAASVKYFNSTYVVLFLWFDVIVKEFITEKTLKMGFGCNSIGY